MQNQGIVTIQSVERMQANMFELAPLSMWLDDFISPRQELEQSHAAGETDLRNDRQENLPLGTVLRHRVDAMMLDDKHTDTTGSHELRQAMP